MARSLFVSVIVLQGVLMGEWVCRCSFGCVVLTTPPDSFIAPAPCFRDTTKPEIRRGNPCNSNSRDVSLLSSVLCAGLYPNVAMRRPGGTNFKTLGGHTARVKETNERIRTVDAPRSALQTSYCSRNLLYTRMRLSVCIFLLVCCCRADIAWLDLAPC